MRIIIVRHGEPNYELDSLTERGFQEAELLSNALVNAGITDIYCSPLGRAQRTAEPTAKKCGLPIEILPWLREFNARIGDPYNPGKTRIPWNLTPRFWTSQPEFYTIDRWQENPYIQQGDMVEKYNTVTASFDELLARYGCTRMENGLYHCEENPHKTIALFCHFGLGMLLVSYLTRMSPFMLWQNFFMAPSSVTTFITEEREKGELFFKCMQLGDTSHLLAGGQEVSHSGLYPEFFGGEGCGPQV